MTTESNALHIYRTIKKMKLRKNMQFTSEVPSKKDYYKILIATILSQNTNDKNSISAFKRLDEKIGVEPNKILNAEINEIAEAIKIGGLYRVKAKKIKEATKEILTRLDGDLTKLANMEYEEARKLLLKISGIGDKTADILLLKMGHPAFPVDTHIKRITRRLGLVNRKAKYLEISEFWRKNLPSENYLDAHLELIAFGRKICKSINPRCNICPLRDTCHYYGEEYGKEGNIKQ